MKILILGGDGMIGHKMAQILSSQNHETVISIREKKDLTLKSISSKSKVFFNDFLNLILVLNIFFKIIFFSKF